MKSKICMALYGLAGGVVLLLPSAGLAADICNQGTGIPPFLSQGARPNLLMVLDNSASMLDAAYSQKGDILNDDGSTIPNPDKSSINLQYQRCMDGDYEIYDNKITGGKVSSSTLIASVEGYDKNASYSGYFEQEEWYKWIDGDYPNWQSGTVYNVGDRVYVYGNIYEAITVVADDGKSNGKTIEQDAGIEWELLFAKEQWVSSRFYAIGSYVWYGSQLYKALETNTGVIPGSDEVTWAAIDSTWEGGDSVTYKAGDIVTYKGIHYEALSDNTSKVPDEYSKTSPPVWKSLRQGNFKWISAAESCPNADGTDYTRTNAVCLSIDESVVPHKVTSFTALGKFLNWATASKFDVEKKILTGGKHNYYEQVFVSEHRGCSGSRQIKQVELDDADGDGSSDGYLVLGVRGSKYDEDDSFMNDRVDTTDDTTRLEVLAVTPKGIQGGVECQSALDDLVEKSDTCGTVSSVNDCLATFQGEGNEDLVKQMNVMNQSLQFCTCYWKSLEPGAKPIVLADGSFANNVNFTAVSGQCSTVYEGGANFSEHPPFTIEPAYGAYFCYGIYDADIPHDERDGYLGRCWKPYTDSESGVTCIRKQAVNPPVGCSDADPCRYTVDGVWYMNKDGFNYTCDFKSDNKCEVTDTDWTTVYVREDIPSVLCKIDGGGWDAADLEDNCLERAAVEYCTDTSVPEVIDPSDQGGGTTDNWNLPGVLADSGVLTQLGGTGPLAVMKGYIEEKDRPQGIIHSVAQSLRLGVMYFNKVGTATECNDTVTPGVEKFCPEYGDRDGALLKPIAEIKDGDKKIDDDPTYPENVRRHVDNLAQVINDIQGSSWTPLGEAMYEAIGYYTQNHTLCLTCNEKDTFLDSDGNPIEYCTNTPGNCQDYRVCSEYDLTDNTCLDPVGPDPDDPDGKLLDPIEDPVQYQCQENHILLITEGESTADVHKHVMTLAEGADDERYLSKGNDIITGDDKYDNKDDGCIDTLYMNSTLDDMTWRGQNVKSLYRHRFIFDYDVQAFDDEKEKNNITTHVVATSKLAGEETNECTAEGIMQAAALNGVPETERDEAGYYKGENPEDLEENLRNVLNDIMSRASSGSAASVISDARSGSGAMYQAVFWPEHSDGYDADPHSVTWIGDVRATLLSPDGRMYEDTDHNGQLDTDVDHEVIFYYSQNVKRTRGCYNVDKFRQGPDGVEGTIDDYQCPGDLNPEDPNAPLQENTCPDDYSGCVEATDVEYLWTANRQLREMDVLTERKVYTWNDADNDGIVDSDTGEWFLLNTSTDWAGLNDIAASTGTRGKVTGDFLTPSDWTSFVGPDSSKTDEEVELDALHSLTKWLLGEDQLGNEEEFDENGNGWLDRELRSRQFYFSDTEMTQEWRLGDVIHSAPTAVSKPAESYNQIYRDPTYSKYAAHWDNRRIVIYFGGNDGMLHAVNGGFYLEDSNQFCCTEETNTVSTTIDGNEVTYEVCAVPLENGECTGADDPNLGEELWAYIPYNLQPHLKCLTDPSYSNNQHKYFVDLKPRIFDVQIFAEESACNGDDPSVENGCIHPGGWGTILVGGMRFGGATVDAMELNSFVDGNGLKDPRQFTSSFFILDITNPEAPPVLLGELTRYTTDKAIGEDDNGNPIFVPVDKEFADLNYTTSSPGMVVMRDGGVGTATSKWYLIMGNGPSNKDGTNEEGEQGRIVVLPLDWLKGAASGWSAGIPSINGSPQPVRVPNAPPNGSGGGVFTVPFADNGSYISDITQVDYNIDDYTLDDLGVRYRTDAVYFGTVDGTAHPEYPEDYYAKSGEQRYWNGGGRLFRLVTKVFNTVDGKEQASTPEDWANVWSDGNPLRMLADLKAPVVSSPAVGYDGYNYWIYAGTGLFYSELDKTDDGRCLPVNSVCLKEDACENNPVCSNDVACTGGDNGCADRSNVAYFGVKEPIKDDRVTTFDGWKSVPTSISGADCYTSDHPLDSDGFNPIMTWDSIDWDVDAMYHTNGEVGADVPNSKVDPNQAPGERGLMQTDNILVGQSTGYLACWHCKMDGELFVCENLASSKCYAGVKENDSFPSGNSSEGPIYDPEAAKDADGNPIAAYTFEKLTDYIAGTGCRENEQGEKIATGLDGWYHVFHDPRERNISTASLLGDILYFTTYQPFNDKCKAEGQSFLYGLYYQTGTASISEAIGTFDPDSNGSTTEEHGSSTPLTYSQHKLVMQGMVMPPTLHNGPDGLRAILTDAAGKTEKKEVGDDQDTRSGRVNWSDQCYSE